MVGDKNHSHVLGLEVTDHLEELFNFVVGEGCGGFIQDENAGMHRECLSNFHHLLSGNTQVADAIVEFYIHTNEI